MRKEYISVIHRRNFYRIEGMFYHSCCHSDVFPADRLDSDRRLLHLLLLFPLYCKLMYLLLLHLLYLSISMCASEQYTKGEKGEFVLTNYKGKKYSLLDDSSEKVQNFNEQMINGYKEKLLNFFGCLERVKTNGKESLLVSLFVVWNRMKLKPILSEEKCKQISEDGILSMMQ